MTNNKNNLDRYTPNITVYILTGSDDWKEMIEDIIHKDSGYNFYGNKAKDIFDRLNCLFNCQEYLKLSNNKYTVVYEPYYIDKVYRDEFYEFYSRRHFVMPSYTRRFTFIQGEYSYDELLECENREEIEKNIYGFAVLKPTKTFGRIIINANKVLAGNNYVMTTKFKTTVMGHKYTIDAFPLSDQDIELMTCAETNIWMIMEYYGNRYEHYKTLLPSEMLQIVKRNAYNRVLPSEGLDVEQQSKIFLNNGMTPVVYEKEVYNEFMFNRFKYRYYDKLTFNKILHFYVESHIPVLVNLRNKDRTKFHCITCIGHSEVNYNYGVDRYIKMKYNKLKGIKLNGIKLNGIKLNCTMKYINSYIFMADNAEPYFQQKNLNKFITDDSKFVIDSIVVPLYKHIFMSAEVAFNVAFSKLNSLADVFDELYKDKKIIYRLFLTSSRSYKDFRIKTAKNFVEKFYYNEMNLPRFVWVFETSTIEKLNNKKVITEFVIDATSAALDITLSLVSVRLGSIAQYRGPLESEEKFTEISNSELSDDFELFDTNMNK